MVSYTTFIHLICYILSSDLRARAGTRPGKTRARSNNYRRRGGARATTDLIAAAGRVEAGHGRLSHDVLRADGGRERSRALHDRRVRVF